MEFFFYGTTCSFFPFLEISVWGPNPPPRVPRRTKSFLVSLERTRIQAILLPSWSQSTLPFPASRPSLTFTLRNDLPVSRKQGVGVSPMSHHKFRFLFSLFPFLSFANLFLNWCYLTRSRLLFFFSNFSLPPFLSISYSPFADPTPPLPSF